VVVSYKRRFGYFLMVLTAAVEAAGFWASDALAIEATTGDGRKVALVAARTGALATLAGVLTDNENSW
jgi:hypothetical protein